MDAKESCDLLSVINAPLVRLGGVSLSYTFTNQAVMAKLYNGVLVGSGGTKLTDLNVIL